MQQKKYSKAIEYFKAAEDCPDKPLSNDLNAKREECLKAIRDAEAEQRRQDELAKKKAQEARNASKGYMEITDVKFANCLDNGTTINEYGSTLYASDMRYLKPRISYTGVANGTKDITLYYKLYKTDGSLRQSSSSPAGYTTSKEVTILPGKNNTLYLPGWGNDNSSVYSVGSQRFELWYNGNCLYSTTVWISRKSGEATYLKVDNKTAVSTSFLAGGSSETFYVSTDADSWTTWGVPSFCTVTDKTSTSFKLVCEANTSTSERTDWMKIKAGDKEVRIDIKQTGKQGPTVKIEKVWVEHNVVKVVNKSVYNVYFGWQQVPTTVKAMRIHVKFNADLMKGRKVRVCAYFDDSNGSAMIGSDSDYITSTGQVTVQGNGTATYEHSTWNDFTLEIPNSAIKNGDNNRFMIQIHDDKGHTVAESGYTYFSMH